MDPSIPSRVSSILLCTDPFQAPSSRAPAFMGASLFCPEQQFVLSYETSSARKRVPEQKENGKVSTELSLGLQGSIPSKKPKVNQERRAAILDHGLLAQKPSKDPRLIRKRLTMSGVDPSIASPVSSILSFTDPFLASSSSSTPAFMGASLFCPEQQFVLSNETSSARKRVPEQKENGMVATELSLGLPGSIPSKKPKVDQERRAAILDHGLLAQKPSKDSRLIRKRLTMSDVNGSCRLLLLIKAVEDYVLSSMEEDKAKMCKTNTGVRFEVWDLDESCGGHHLVLKKWAGTNYFVLTGGWKKNFVNRKGLEKGDEVGVAFDGTRFYFKLLNKN